MIGIKIYYIIAFSFEVVASLSSRQLEHDSHVDTGGSYGIAF